MSALEAARRLEHRLRQFILSREGARGGRLELAKARLLLRQIDEVPLRLAEAAGDPALEDGVRKETDEFLAVVERFLSEHERAAGPAPSR